MIENLSEKLKNKRAAEKLSQPEFAQKNNFPVTTYRTWEHRKTENSEKINVEWIEQVEVSDE